MLRNPPAVIGNLADYKKGMAGFHAAFPDLHFTVNDQVAEGDKVVIRWTLRGTQTSDYLGHPPFRKTMAVTGVSLFRIAGGKIQEIHVAAKVKSSADDSFVLAEENKSDPWGRKLQAA